MGESNRLVISGTVVFVGPRRTSPAGISQQRLTIEHRSRQVEAGVAREARCRLDVKIAGDEVAADTGSFEPGQWIEVEGFLTNAGFNSERLKGGDVDLVLHAVRIRTGDSADKKDK